jgi:hypothetical protein
MRDVSKQKKLYNGIPNIAVWRVLRKRLHLKVYKLSIVEHLERWIVYTPSECKRFRNTRHTAAFGIKL